MPEPPMMPSTDLVMGSASYRFVIASDPPPLAPRATSGSSPSKRGAQRRKRSNLRHELRATGGDCFVALRAPRNDQLTQTKGPVPGPFVNIRRDARSMHVRP